jgi:hypothetical protein
MGEGESMIVKKRISRVRRKGKERKKVKKKRKRVYG